MKGATAQGPKNSTKIMISNSLTAQENFLLVSQKLLGNDYYIESKDKELFYLKTQQKPINKWTGVYFLNIVAFDNKIQITGMMNSTQEITISGITTKSEFTPIILKGGLYKECFILMDSFAKKIEGDISYK